MTLITFQCDVMNLQGACTPAGYRWPASGFEVSGQRLGTRVCVWQLWWPGHEKPELVASGTPRDSFHEVPWVWVGCPNSLCGQATCPCCQEEVSVAARGRPWTTRGDPYHSSGIVQHGADLLEEEYTPHQPRSREFVSPPVNITKT